MSSEWYLSGTQRLEVRLVEKAFKGAYRRAVFKSRDAKSVEVTFDDGTSSKVPKNRVRPQVPFTPDSWLAKLALGDDVECKVDADWWPTQLVEMPTTKGVYKLRSVAHKKEFAVDKSDMRPGWVFDSKNGEWKDMKGEQCYSPSCMTLVSSSPLWSMAKKAPTLDDLSKFSSFSKLAQWLTSRGETLYVELTCQRILETGNMPMPVLVVMEFHIKNIIATTSPATHTRLEPTSFKSTITNKFDIQTFHVDSKGLLAQRRYSSAEELDDDLYLGDGVVVTSATEKDRIQIQTPTAESAESCWLSRLIFAMDVCVSHPHVPIFAWSRSLEKLVALNKVFVGAEDAKDSAMDLVETAEMTASTEKPNPKDVCEVKWPKLFFRLPYTTESDVVLNETHSRVEWVESGFLTRTVETLVAQNCVPNLYTTVPAATMRSLKVYWMRWLTPIRLLVVFVHPGGGRASLMGVDMSLGDVYKIRETREWIESPENTLVHICRPSPSPKPRRLLEGRAKIDVAKSIIFPDVSYRPDNSFHTLVAYTEMLKESYDATGKKLFVRKIAVTEPIGDLSLLPAEPSKYTCGRIGLPLFGSGVSCSITEPVRMYGRGGKDGMQQSTLMIHSGDTTVMTTATFVVMNSHVDVDAESKMLLVGRELSWLSCLCCPTLHPSRWFDEAEHAALHALVEWHGSFIGRISMKRIQLRSLQHKEGVWWVVYPRTTVTVTSGDAARCVFGDAAFPNEPLEQVYIKMLQNAHTEELIQIHFDKIVGRDKAGVSPDVVAFKGRCGLASAAQYASSRGLERTSHLLVAVALTSDELDAHKGRLDAEYRTSELEMKRERADARRDYPELCKKFHDDKQIARRRIRIEDGDPIVKYKRAMKLHLDTKAKKEEDEEFSHKGGRIFHNLGLSPGHLMLGVIFNDFKTKQ